MKHSPQDIVAMRASGQTAARILKEVALRVQAGITPKELDRIARKEIESAKVKPAFLGYDKFPAVLCVSVNSVAVHGAPSDIEFCEGDVVGLDFGVIKNGWYSDLAITVGVGQISSEAQKLITVCKTALERAISVLKEGVSVGDISSTIQTYVEGNGFLVIRELVGHGIGKNLHELPHVPNFGKPGIGEVLEEGATIAIEPIISVSDEHVELDSDQFSWRTKKGSLAAHFEHTVVVTKEGADILTLP
ncbi:MAG: type I methionyl aminopeptidase [Candidatus Terrybacteria bacterium RIFCSPHIGHO2_01_FULL_48_17]|uniref:Methionine aminopeptidase n=1 Tax=Candidatus Terrybacteria bacterium RIFCSPHIGHO2_01_FULL_48_17 TaxID=1802362 RepID=A0A1G2PKR6_9BACT|nr:MAG: type I methionyl aminopeptidase [Candidatus Terrybacteria bacterium RIFCSPHIGHO2_01_FULL_48_17]OHA52108.1 MAG: type I methionyl aminopeptidase [Candidatus Terrybacteria bacterium RIFCSPLOWO2_01_FULL_48_14]